MTKLRTLTLSLALTLAASNALSQTTPHPRFSQNHTHRTEFGGYLAPNEAVTDITHSLVSQSPAGLLLTVGSERAYSLAAMNAAATGVIVADYDPEIIKFHRINLKLIRLSQGSRLKYLELRKATAFETWSKGFTSEEFEWWQKKVNTYQFEDFLNRESDFEKFNYTRDDTHFKRIYDLALNKKFRIVRLDFNNLSQVKWLVQQVKKMNAPIGQVDISNAYDPHYISEQNFADFLRELGTVTLENSILSFAVKKYWSGLSVLRQWAYSAVTFGHLKGPPWQGRTLQKVISNYESAATADQIEGKLNPEAFLQPLIKSAALTGQEFFRIRTEKHISAFDLEIALWLIERGHPISATDIEKLIVISMELSGPYHKDSHERALRARSQLNQVSDYTLERLQAISNREEQDAGTRGIKEFFEGKLRPQKRGFSCRQLLF